MKNHAKRIEPSCELIRYSIGNSVYLSLAQKITMPYNKPNFKRMLALIDEVFTSRKDPGQLRVDEKVLKKLGKIHTACLSEHADENGPDVWILLIPTTAKLMNEFLTEKISEQELFEQTKPGEKYETIYLCSASTLPEYRGKGLTKKLALHAITSIKKDHDIKTLFVWPFTKEGEKLAERLGQETGLELKVRS